MRKTVNAPRPYDARERRARAEHRQDLILDAAWNLFLAGGYGPTTVAGIAGQAGVSAETVYKGFGGKAGLVRAIYGRSLLGRGPDPAEHRSDVLQAEETDAGALLRQFGVFVTEVAPLVVPVLLLIRDAAAGGDKDMAALLAEVEATRLERMTHNAATLVDRGLLAPGLTTAFAADVMWTYTAPGMYENLVIKRGWERGEYGRFIGNALAAALLE
ncbi:MAG: TetR/AcrR family transcriptional regulator [Actinomycetales bacterium]